MNGVLRLLVLCAGLVTLAVAEARPLNLQAQIDAAVKAGGGRIVVPKGTWATGRLALGSNVELHFEDGAALVFDERPESYLPMVQTCWQGEEMLNLSPLVYACGATNVAITGRGTLKTSTAAWREWHERTKGRRPQFVQFFACRNVRLQDFAIRGTPFWTLHLYRTDDVTVDRLDISAYDDNGLALANSDGIDIECSRHVRVRNCSFRQNDDSVVIKSGRDIAGIRRGLPSEDIVIEGCRIHGGRTSLLSIGSEVGGGVRNVTMRNCTADGALNSMLFVKTNAKRGGFIEDITFEKCVADQVRDAAVFVLANYWYHPRPGTRFLRRTPIRNLTVRDIRLTACDRAVDVRGDPELPVRGMTIDGLSADTVRRRMFAIDNVEDVKVSGVVVKHPPQLPLDENDPTRGGQESDPTE